MKSIKEKLLPTIGVSTLGCPKNLIDTENIIGILHAAGYPITQDHSKADISLVNTCTFISDSTNESKEVLSKLSNDGKKLVITGCMAQRYKEGLFKEFPQTQAVVGTGNIQDILSVIKQITKNLNYSKDSKIVKVDKEPKKVADSKVPRINTQIGPSAYLKIGEGCNHRCSFCIIPHLRGNMRSRTIEDIVNEAKHLVKNGIKEIILVSQDSTSYGIDIYKKQALADLLKAVSEKSGAKWIRLMYAYPTELNEDMLKIIAKKQNIVKYIDIPFQHASKKILKSMKRPPHVQKTVNLIRKILPEAAIRTTFITGYPQESEDDFNELYNFVKENKFDRVGVFTYSKEAETPAASFKNQVSEEIKQKRKEKLMLLQQKISLKKNKSFIGKTLEMLVEHIEHHENKKLKIVGRSYRDAPEIDGQLYLNIKDKSHVPQPGDFIPVKVTGCNEYDLFCAPD